MLEQCCNHSKQCRNNVATVALKIVVANRLVLHHLKSTVHLTTRMSDIIAWEASTLCACCGERIQVSLACMQAPIDIQWIHIFPVDNAVVYPDSYSLNSEFSAG